MTFRLKLFSKNPPKLDGESSKAAADGSGASSFRASVAALAGIEEQVQESIAEKSELMPLGTGSPHIKTYAAASVAQAMLAARREMGDDAILIQTKRLDPSSDPLLQYEVTFGVIPGAAFPPPAQPASPPLPEASVPVASPALASASPGQSPSPQPDSEAAWLEEIGQLRQDIAALTELLSQQFRSSPTAPAPFRRSSRIRHLLIKSGLDEDLASDWASQLAEVMPAEGAADDAEVDLTTLQTFLSARVNADSSLGAGDSESRAVVLVGPPAAGKTTALIKLALEYGLMQGRTVQLFAFDPRRGEMNRALETTASIINMPCKTFSTVAALKAALRVPRPAKTLVLVDTEGFAAGCSEQEKEFAAMVLDGGVDVHLVLSAAWHARSLRGAVDYFEVFQPSRLLFTMLDHPGSVGPLLQEAWRTRKPLSFLNNGPLGVGNIVPASIRLLLSNVDEPAQSQ